MLSWQVQGFDEDATITVLKLGHSDKDVWLGLSDASIVNEREQNYWITSLAFHETSQRVFLSDTLESQFIWSLREQKVISELNYFRGARTFRESLFVDNGRKLITASSKKKSHCGI